MGDVVGLRVGSLNGAVLAEAAGFDMVVVSEHFHPWVDDASASGFAFSTIGAMAARTGDTSLAAFADGVLRPADGASWCEWKGQAAYFDLVVGDEVLPTVAWTYPTPSKGFEQLVDHVALYPGRVDRCTVDGEVVEPQPGGFYGGWITSRVTGPFKGAPGTRGW